MALKSALERLLATWDSCGADIAGRLAPGDPPGVIRSTIGRLGYDASQEVVDWFAWQGGVAVDNTLVGPALEPFSLAQALRARTIMLQLNEDLRSLEAPESELWQLSWVPLVHLPHGGYFAADLAVGGPDTSPVWRHDESARAGHVAGSVSAMIDGWIALIDGGYWLWDPHQHSWGQGPERPPEVLAGFDV